MEYWQKRYIEEGLVFPGLGPGLMTIDLPNKGLLGCVEFRIRARHPNVAGKVDVWIHDNLRKIELVVNGSEVVKSLTGDQVLAINMYDHSYNEGTEHYNTINTNKGEHFMLNLGRFYHDDEYMLDLGKVNDPELRIHYDWTLAGHDGWGNGWTLAVAPSIWVIPHILRETDKYPKGYIKTSEVHRFTSAPGLNYNMTIPRGPVYNGLYLQSRYQGNGLSNQIDHLEVNIDNSRLIPFRVTARDFEAECARKFGEFSRTEVTDPDAAAQVPAPIEVGRVWESQYIGSDCIGTTGYLWGGWCATINRSISGFILNASPNVHRMFHYKGVWPFALAKLPYLDEMKPETWIHSNDLGDFWVRVEELPGAGALSTFKLLADEVITQ